MSEYYIDPSFTPNEWEGQGHHLFEMGLLDSGLAGSVHSRQCNCSYMEWKREERAGLTRWSLDIASERAHQVEKGYDDTHDDEHGADHLLLWASEYARRGEPVKSAALIEAARKVLERLTKEFSDRHEASMIVDALIAAGLLVGNPDNDKVMVDELQGRETLPLDPKPYVLKISMSERYTIKAVHRIYSLVRFAPRDGFNQDEAAYRSGKKS